jgi:hypothetical protein
VIFAKEALRGRLPKFVELLKFRSLAVGAKVLGVVATVTATNLTVSLPHGLKGNVTLAEVSGSNLPGLFLFYWRLFSKFLGNLVLSVTYCWHCFLFSLPLWNSFISTSGYLLLFLLFSRQLIFGGLCLFFCPYHGFGEDIVYTTYCTWSSRRDIILNSRMFGMGLQLLMHVSHVTVVVHATGFDLSFMSYMSNRIRKRIHE